MRAYLEARDPRSLLLQALLGANVDGSGLSLHADGRTS